ncbi:hypothetical protein HK102_001013 [Quaeritorhiza haematococci]|nr:hypothetical protein HK102_001013 [Quaeritorhiza haematococci]
MKIALITGITGMDGSYLAEFLLNKGYQVHGIVRRASTFNTKRIDHLFNRLVLHYSDVTDAMSITSVIQRVKPDEIYNLAAMSHIKVSFEIEQYTFQVNTIGVLNILQAVKTLGLSMTTKVYQASTLEMFRNANHTSPLTERSDMVPVSPYGISKLAAHHIANYYRDAFDMFVVSSILLNHEGEQRGPTFVTQKIADHVARYHCRPQGLSDPANAEILLLGNLDAKQDWGYYKDYVEGIWLMMQQDAPDNYLLATSKTHSVREFVELAFVKIGVKIRWVGQGIAEIGVNDATGQVVVRTDQRYHRPLEVNHLVGDYSKARTRLGWASKTSFPDLVRIMVHHALG